MERYSALIVEDVKDTSDYILQRIRALCPFLQSVDQVFTLEDAEVMIENNSYEILFLDIQMPSGTSFDLLKRLSEKNKINFEIIFITGESAKEYTLRAIKFSAIDFLYKPLDDAELIVAVNRAIERINKQSYNHQVKLLLNRIDEQVSVKTNKIAFHLYNGIVQMAGIDELMYMEADGVISKAHLSTGETLTVNRNLGYYKDILIIDYKFIPLSNSILINRDYIKRYNHQTLKVTLTDNTELRVSRRRGKELKDLLSDKKGIHCFLSSLNPFNK